MRIVYCIPATSNSGGMERVLTRKVNYLVEQGHELIIVTTDQKGAKPFFPLEGSVKQYDLGINYDENNGQGILAKLTAYPKKKTSAPSAFERALRAAPSRCRYLDVWG